MDYVQIPNAKPEIAEEAKEEDFVEETLEERKEKKKAELVKQMSLSTDERGIFFVFKFYLKINISILIQR